ncbi:MAG: phosphoethanolamine transferase [Bacteroidia bacterium]|nr:phosphoethanolamine transferase [Bacteroidia bacterium]NNF31491.1 lipid A phosphoethanolamine transferase [Flavobacteriaceae bacterium]MBT8275566.1 phosphoethanolamine transferase [Bacteroidia bacterium]NNJ82034.1 lipid A phosphoethanolamine transferase [Flavobacteriaceae bacterium]NNK54070.1 lipid A phosphoethanolamine transferase [Flavobacteriaceae bacterium]
MEKLKRIKPVIVFHLVLNAIIVVFITGASYYHVPLEGLKDHAIYFLHLCALQSTVAGILYVLSLFKWTFRVVFSILFLSYCGFSFWAYSQDISITRSLIQGVMETKPDIAIDLITIPYFIFYLVAIAVLIFILNWHGRLNRRKGFRIFIVPAVALIIMFFVFERKQYGIFKFRLPYNVVVALDDYYEQPPFKLEQKIPPVHSGTDSLKVVFVLGETVRADHLGLNGYNRNTTPLLSQRKDIISYSNLFTSKTITATSLPQILTDQLLTDTIGSYTSLYSVVNDGGFKTTWIGNQTMEKSYLPIVETNRDIILVDKYKSVFSFDKELDGVMLKPIDSLLRLNDKQLITIHMIGSHWWYENRYEDRHRKFTPVIDSKYIPSLTKEQVINSYDNTVVYLDYFLNEIITRLEKERLPTFMIYVSDHGEILGEGGKWLHAQEDDALKNPGYILWFSESFRQWYPGKVTAIEQLKNSEITTDVIYPTLLDLLDLQVSEGK